MAHRGYIKLYRRLQNNPLWLSEPFTRGQAWIDLIMLANHTDGYIRKRGIRIEIKRGQIGHSELSLAERWKWSRGKVRRFLSELSQKTVQQIVQQKTKLTSVITIVNYDMYQSDSTTDGTTSSTTDGQQTDIKRYRNKNDKNDKNDKKQTKTSTALSRFDEFWKAYPKKKNKGTAEKAWKKLSLGNGLFDKVIAGVERAKGTPDWQKENGTFIPHPASWLNARGWEDEILKPDIPQPTPLPPQEF